MVRIVKLWCFYIICTAFASVQPQKRGNNHKELDLNKSPAAEPDSDDNINRFPNKASEAAANLGSQIRHEMTVRQSGLSAQISDHNDIYSAREQMHMKALQEAKETGRSYQKVYWKIKKQAFLENMRVNQPDRWTARQETKRDKRNKLRMEDYKNPKSKYQRLLKLRREGSITPAQRVELAQETKKSSERILKSRKKAKQIDP